MITYEFSLIFLSSAEEDPDMYVEGLSKLGGDATIGIGRGLLGLDREAVSANAAIESAIRDVRKVIPAAKLIEASPDFVGLTEAARNRQGWLLHARTCANSC